MLLFSMLTFCGKSIKMWGWSCYRLTGFTGKSRETERRPLHDATLMQAASLGCTQKSWQSFCQRAFRHDWQRILNKERTRFLEWFAAETRNAVLQSGIMDQLSKQNPSTALFQWFNVTDGGWKLTTTPKSAHIHGKTLEYFSPWRPLKV